VIVPTAERRRLIALVVWAAYCLAPNDAGGPIDGLAVGPIEAVALLAIGWLALYGGQLRFSLIAAAASIVSLAVGAAIPGSPGLRARYFANPDGTGAPERSAEFITSPFTRIDTRLHFTPGGPELPLNFFNDNTRYSLFQVAYTRHDQLPFAARWSGEWWVSGSVDAIYVQAPQATGEVFIDGHLAATVGPADDDGESVVGVTLSEGWHRLDVALTSPYGAPRQFAAGTVNGGTRHPFDATAVLTQRIRPWQVTAARVLRLVKTAFDFAALLFVGAVFLISLSRTVRALVEPATDAKRRTQVIAVFAAVAAADALRVAWPWSARMMLLVAGDDTATYETFARDILFNGILMSGGKPLGQGEPFYYQAFYPYFLALEHVIGGEFMFGVVLIQRLLAAYAIVKLVEIAVRFTSERGWTVALPIAAAFVGWKFWRIAGLPLNESLYVPLLIGSIAALIRLCDRPTSQSAIWTGVLCGLTAITRSTALLAWIVCAPLLWLAVRRGNARSPVLSRLAVSLLAVFSLIAMRNAIVAHVFAPTPTELGITLLGGNEPPAGFTIDQGRAPIYRRLGMSDLTATVVDYAIAQPRLFATNLMDKALFVLGFYERYAPGWGNSPVYIATWISAVAGLWLTIKRRGTPLWPLLIPAAVAITQFLAIVIIYPKGERLVVPVHIVLIPYSAAAVWYALNRRSSEAANANLIASRTST
jgi:hypothetical protein